MNNNPINKPIFFNKPAFTIIEVIIVLVIGAIIMLAVFLVVPVLQRSQRNTNRQNAARRVFAAAEQVSAKTGAYPVIGTAAGGSVNCYGSLSVTSNCKIITDITGNVNTATGGNQYTIKNAFNTPASPIADVNNIYLNNNTSDTNGCLNGKLVNSGASASRFAVAVVQETNSSQTGSSFCLTYP